MGSSALLLRLIQGPPMLLRISLSQEESESGFESGFESDEEGVANSKLVLAHTSCGSGHS